MSGEPLGNCWILRGVALCTALRRPLCVWPSPASPFNRKEAPTGRHPQADPCLHTQVKKRPAHLSLAGSTLVASLALDSQALQECQGVGLRTHKAWPTAHLPDSCSCPETLTRNVEALGLSCKIKPPEPGVRPKWASVCVPCMTLRPRVRIRVWSPGSPEKKGLLNVMTDKILSVPLLDSNACSRCSKCCMDLALKGSHQHHPLKPSHRKEVTCWRGQLSTISS